MDAVSQKRVACLRDEVASLRRDNDLYRLRKRRTRLEASANESRRYRLSQIKEELMAIGIFPRNKV
jgi:hypothetical protein